MKKKIMKHLILVARMKYSTDKLNTIWEIFCEENDIDYDDKKAGKVFDKMVENNEI
jgi:hypothetical protein